MNDLISRSALLEELSKGTIITDDLYGMGIMAGNDHAMKKIEAAPAVDAVSRAVHEQVMWERDTAIEQLNEHGIPFGGIAPDVVEVVRCKDCEHGEIDDPDFPYQYYCHMGHMCNDAFHFCADGERRADNESTC